MILAFLQKKSGCPVIRSWNRIPAAMTRSAWFRRFTAGADHPHHPGVKIAPQQSAAYTRRAKQPASSKKRHKIGWGSANSSARARRQIDRRRENRWLACKRENATRIHARRRVARLAQHDFATKCRRADNPFAHQKRNEQGSHTLRTHSRNRRAA